MFVTTGIKRKEKSLQACTVGKSGCLSGCFPRSTLGGCGEHSVRKKTELPNVSLCQCFYFFLCWSSGKNSKEVPQLSSPARLNSHSPEILALRSSNLPPSPLLGEDPDRLGATPSPGAFSFSSFQYLPHGALSYPIIQSQAVLLWRGVPIPHTLAAFL